MELDDRGRTLAVIEDLTVRKRFERESALLRRAIEQSGEAVVITDATGSIEYVNPHFERSTGYSADEVLGRNPRLLQGGGTSNSEYSAMWERLGAGEVVRIRFSNRKKDGSLYTQETTISPVKDPVDDTITHYIGVGADVTELLSIEEQLRQSQKLEAVGLLTSGLAHDFNNLLGVILTNTGLASAGGDGSASLPEYLREIKDAGERARAIVRQLLGFGRRTRLELGAVDVGETVHELTGMLRRLLPEDVRVESTGFDAGVIVQADRGAVEQILVNLATNARDAMPHGGVLSVEVDAVRLSKRDIVTHPWARPGAFGRITVADTGTGIDPADLDRVFEPFFTTKEPGRGTGLGLSMVYGLVKQHDGFVHVYSEAGRGTTIRIYFPVSGERPSTQKVPHHSEKVAGGSETVLLVEDDVALRKAGDRVLRRAGYHVVLACDGAEALARLGERLEGIDLIVSDSVMPGMSGAELYSAVRALGSTVPFALSSGHIDRGLGVDTDHLEGVPFLAKPWTVESLLTFVRETLDQHAQS